MIRWPTVHPCFGAVHGLAERLSEVGAVNHPPHRRRYKQVGTCNLENSKGGAHVLASPSAFCQQSASQCAVTTIPPQPHAISLAPQPDRALRNATISGHMRSPILILRVTNFLINRLLLHRLRIPESTVRRTRRL